MFDDEKKQLVISLTNRVSNCINLLEACPPSQDHVNDVIEEVLMRNNKRDMSHAFIAKRRPKNKYHKRFKESHKLSLIMRDGSFVLWDIEQIKHAIEFAFTANHQSPERAANLSPAVTKNILDKELSFRH
jgi:hypothetical protein